MTIHGRMTIRLVERPAPVLSAPRVARGAVLDPVKHERVARAVVDLLAEDALAEDAHLAVTAVLVELLRARALRRGGLPGRERREGLGHVRGRVVGRRE